MARAGGKRRQLSSVLRVIACLLLATIVADVTGDLKCDPVSVGSASTLAVRGPAQAGSDDSCAPSCVPDCFCCSRSLVAGTAIPVPGPAALTPFGAPAVSHWPEGVRPVVDRPPQLRA